MFERSSRLNTADNAFVRAGVLNDADNPWEVCNNYYKKHTDKLRESWRREIDTLLVFAGLFSAVVTIFVVESSNTIKEDSTKATVLLLRTIVLQLDNMTNPRFDGAPELNPGAERATQLAIRINILWFLSLTLSLSAALVGILCNQWIREFGRTANVPHREHVALHHMRYEGIERWHVFKILSALPLLLIGALLTFFAGLVELWWETDKRIAIPIIVVVGIASLFLLVTTLLPALQSIYIWAFPSVHFAQSPFKSPQAWMVYKIVSFFCYFVFRFIPGREHRGTKTEDLDLDLFQPESWPDYDQFLRRHRDAHLKLVSRCIRELDPRIGLEASLARMNCRRAASVRRARDHVPSFAPRDSERGRAKADFTEDLVVSHTLEHFAQKIEQGHMYSPLLQQRIMLFLKINEGEFMDQDVDCPVNRDNAALILRETRERIVQCISTMLRKYLNCNVTQTSGAFEVIRSFFLENFPNGSPLVMSDFLEELMRWIRRQPSGPLTEEKPQRRLKQGLLFDKLIFFCRDVEDRSIVDGYRQQLDDHIKDLFGKELDAMESPLKPLGFPYLSRYMAWQGLG